MFQTFKYISRNTDSKKSKKVNFEWLQKKVVTRKFKDGVVFILYLFTRLLDRLLPVVVCSVEVAVVGVSVKR